jgi:hypothetical protein
MTGGQRVGEPRHELDVPEPAVHGGARWETVDQLVAQLLDPRSQQRQTKSPALTYDDATDSAGYFMSTDIQHELHG